MNRVLIVSPALTNSGYMCHSREIIESIEKMDNIEIMISLLSWGSCSWLSGGAYKDRIISYSRRFADWSTSVPKKPVDCVLHVSVPPEFERHFPCPYICVTAGIEADKVSPEWLLKVNQHADHLVVPSNFIKGLFESSTFVMQNTLTGEEKVGKLEKPVTVIPESVDIEVFNNKVECKLDMNFEPDFCFITTGQWGGGNISEERKNLTLLIKWFKEVFKDRKDVGLILKANLVSNCLMDREATERRVRDIINNFNLSCPYPKIYLIHDYLTDNEMAQLYRHPKIKVYITLTHGEAWGRPICEAVACDVPVMAPNWSGHKEFLDKGKWVKFDIQMTDVPQCHIGNLFCQGSKWASPIEDDVKRKMRRIVENYTTPKEWSIDLGTKIRSLYNKEVIYKTWSEFLISHKFINPDKGKNELTSVQEFD